MDAASPSFDGAGYAASADAVVEESVARHLELLGLARGFAQAQREWQRLAAAEAETAAKTARTDHERQVALIRDRAERSEAVIASDVHDATDALAPGAMALPWLATEWSDVLPSPRPRGAAWVRIGSIPLSHSPVGKSQVSALVPLLDHPGWLVTSEAEEFSSLMQGVLLRLLATVPLHRLEVIVFDPVLELSLGGFQSVRDASRSTLPPALTAPGAFADELARVVSAMVRVTDELGNQGVGTVTEHWQALGSLELTYRLVVVNSYPHAISKAVQDSLLQIARTAGTRGVSLIVRRDPHAAPAPDVQTRALEEFLTPMALTPTAVSVASLPDMPVIRDGTPPRALIEEVVGRVVTAGSRSGMPTLPLADVLAEIPDPWADAEPDGLRAAFGRVARRPLTLRLLSADPPLPNALIGGATGQGKSNLLLAIIHALAVRYRPEDLRMFLLDFRQGVELSSLGPSAADPTWLPHAEVLGLESDREFGLSVLEHLVAQFALRSQALTAAGAKSIVDYVGDGKGLMPRLLLVIDEFQMLFDGDDETARRAVELLEQLARQGRGYGVHLILASQTTSGIRGLATKGEAIFGQFPNRLSLKNTPTESQAILGQGNKAAAALTYRGEIIVNENFGDPESNQVGVVAFSADDVLRDVRHELWTRARPRTVPPLVFFGARAARWDSDAASALATTWGTGGEGSYQAWVARPVSVDSTPLAVPIRREGDQGVLLAGSHDDTGRGVLSAMMASVAVQASRPTTWVVLDGTTPSGPESAAAEEWLDQSIRLARDAGHDVLLVPRHEVRQYLAWTGASLLVGRGDSKPDVFVWVIAPQRVPDLATPEVDEFGRFASAKDNLAALVRDGGPVGVFVVGWWVNMRTAVSHLGFQTAGIGAHVLFGLAREEMHGLIDPRQPVPQGHPRVIVKDPRAGAENRIGIPFAPLTGEAVTAIEAILRPAVPTSDTGTADR